MSAITVKIVLQGLLALVPNNEHGGTNQMTVLMLDGNHSHGIECVSGEKYKHKPKLQIEAENSNCADAKCAVSQGFCNCEGTALARKEIWLEIQPQPRPPLKQMPMDPPRGIPGNRQEAAELRYVANMARHPLNLSLNGQYLSASPPSSLVARLQFPFESITSCELGQRFDGGEAFVHALGFRMLGAPSKCSDASQAMAQRVIASVTIPDPGTAGPKVILHLKDLDTQAEATIPLQPRGQVYWIGFSNTSEKLPIDDPCDDGVARHFALFYELAETPPPMEEQLIPHVRFTQSKRADELDPQECKNIPLTLNPLDRPICPLVMFNPPMER